MIGKLPRPCFGLGLPLDFAREFSIPRPDLVRPMTSAPPPQLPCVIFCHGYLGSRLDFCHVCEALAGEGFLVAAPELAESLSATFDPVAATSRGAIVAAALRRLRWDGSSSGDSSDSSDSSDSRDGKEDSP